MKINTVGYIEINAFGVVFRPSYLVTNHVEQRNFLNMFKYVFSSNSFTLLCFTSRNPAINLSYLNHFVLNRNIY